jgi:hypothetical protein
VKPLRDKAGDVTGEATVTLAKDEGNRAGTMLESLASLRAVMGNVHRRRYGRRRPVRNRMTAGGTFSRLD